MFFKTKTFHYPLTICGNGKQKRDYVHISDVVNAFYLAAMSTQKSQIYNLGYGKPNTVKKLANIISTNFRKFLTGKANHLPHMLIFLKLKDI